MACVSTAASHGFSAYVLKLFAPGTRAPLAAIDFVQEPKFALQKKIGERDLPIIQMGEVDAGVENPPSGVLRMIDRAATQHADFDPVVEQRKIDGGLEVGRGAVALGVQEVRVDQGHLADLAGAFDPRLAQIGRAGPLKIVKLFQRLALWPEHGVDKVQPAFGIGENVRGEQPLIDFEAFLGALLPERAFVRYALPRRHDARKKLGHVIKHFAQPQRFGAIAGDGIVDFACVPAQEIFLLPRASAA